MTPEQIAEGRALVAKATQGEWSFWGGGSTYAVNAGRVRVVGNDTDVHSRDVLPNAIDLRAPGDRMIASNAGVLRWADAELLTAAVNAYPAYLDLCERVGGWRRRCGRSPT